MGSLTISSDSRFLRFFLWVWKADPATLNLCKLFWGTILLPLFPIVLLIRTDTHPLPKAAVFIVCGVCGVISGVWWAAVLNFLAGMSQIIEFLRQKFPQKSRFLSIISRYLEWIVDNSLGRLIGFLGGVYYDKVEPSRHITSFFSMCRLYLRSAKERVCPRIQVLSEVNQ